LNGLLLLYKIWRKMDRPAITWKPIQPSFMLRPATLFTPFAPGLPCFNV